MGKTYIVKVATTGKVEREEFRADDPIGQLQSAVGGYIERVPVPMVRGHDLFVNEEGLLDGLPTNPVLTEFCRRRKGASYFGKIVGDGVFAAHGADGETRGLTSAECVDFEKVIAGYAKGRQGGATSRAGALPS